MSCYSNKAMVDPVLFRALYGVGLRVSEALNLTLSDVDTSAGTLRIRDSKTGAGRTIPITVRLTATLDAYTTAAHPASERSDNVFSQQGCGQADRQVDHLHPVPWLPGRRRHPPLHRRSPSALAAPRLRRGQPATVGRS